MYPEANIWFVGHSLGGALASLVGVTFGTPVVAFEAPGERRAAQRLHLPSPVTRPRVNPTPILRQFLALNPAYNPRISHS